MTMYVAFLTPPHNINPPSPSELKYCQLFYHVEEGRPGATTSVLSGMPLYFHLPTTVGTPSVCHVHFFQTRLALAHTQSLKSQNL